ncbi:MAG TPA: hypothetical protein VNI54_10800 [Thermoanaerobaculia bacterium]|nr:hypothetical protein [Thermoanaerobaculia bacterium]
MTLVIRKADRSDVDSLGRLGAMLVRTHYTFDPLRFLGAGEHTELGYA